MEPPGNVIISEPEFGKNRKMRSFIVDLSIRSDDIPELCLPEGITPGNIGKWWID